MSKIIEATLKLLDEAYQINEDYTHEWTGHVNGKEWSIPLKRHEIEGDISDKETKRRIVKHNPHLSSSEHQAIHDAAGEDGTYHGHEVTHHDEVRRLY